jgi:plasmid rolling circle replication initiator protein Rep
MLEKSPPDEAFSYTYLTEISPKDKPWDKRKSESKLVARLYQDTDLNRYANRIKDCGAYLGFKWVIDPKTEKLKLKLNACRFCRCRHCPICQWRRALMWIARFLGVVSTMIKDYPSARYIFLTLTVKNCELSELRKTLVWMNKSWQRMIQRKAFPAIGFARSTEITKASDGKVHPHFHALLMVPSTYFKGTEYITQADWTELWRKSLRVDYTPIVNVKAVKKRCKRTESQNEGIVSLDGSDASEAILDASDEISSAIVETFKYSIKPSDLIGTGSDADREWLVGLTDQLHKTRSISLGGVFKNYLSEDEPENLIGNKNEENDKISDITFGFREILERYIELKLW